jgi:uncharacterized protein (TIGR02996 family)
MATDEATLLQAVIDDPDDMSPRLALADLWGGERGELIRVQIEQSESMRAGRPFSKPAMRAHQLLQGNAKRWAGPIADRVLEARFVRGFVEWVVVDAAVFVRDWKALFAMAPIRHLDVVHAKPAIAELVDCPGLERIVGLSFNFAGTPRYDPIGDDAAIALAASPRLKNLRYLDLGHSKLSEAGLAAIASSPNLPRLEVADLSGNAIPEMVEVTSGDYDGTTLDAWPGPGLVDFESRHGRREWLHPIQRRGRQVFREEI